VTEEAETIPQGEATIEDVRAVLRGIIDPELYISIVDLGLVYETRLDESGEVLVRHTLTTPFCPVGPMIQQQIQSGISRLPGVRGVKVELTFDPPWNPKTMASDEAKDQLGLW
jgi:metal-sulfur cluster biosynthetic enzyme